MLIKTQNICKWYGKEITAEKYNEILMILRNSPTAPEGYGYRLTESLDWELYKLPPVEVEEDPELTDSEALEKEKNK